MFLQLEREWVIWSHQPTIFGIWSLGFSMKQTPWWNFKYTWVFWQRGASCKGGRREEAGAGRVTPLREDRGARRMAKGSSKKVLARPSETCRAKTAREKSSRLGRGGPALVPPAHLVMGWAPNKHGTCVDTMVDPEGTATAGCQPIKVLMAVCLWKEDFRGAFPWLAQRFISLLRHFGFLVFLMLRGSFIGAGSFCACLLST